MTLNYLESMRREDGTERLRDRSNQSRSCTRALAQAKLKLKCLRQRT